MDAYNHINNVMYFKYFETARIAHFQRLGNTLSAQHGQEGKDFYDGFINAKGVGPILASTNCSFKFPGSYPDKLIAGSRIDKTSIEDDRFVSIDDLL